MTVRLVVELDQLTTGRLPELGFGVVARISHGISGIGA